MIGTWEGDIPRRSQRRATILTPAADLDLEAVRIFVRYTKTAAFRPEGLWK
ncbi:MAG: hypothetical protein IPF82_12735 [Blastocatellia bacterium]|nr:hypothetical protein [Blastocatellia bacterium]